MNVTFIQIIIIVFALFAWSRAMLRLRDSNISVGEFSFWSMIWSIVIIVALFPDIISGVSKLVGIGRGVDLAVYAGVILLFYLMFRLYVKMDMQARETTKLVRDIAIKNAKKKK